MPEDKSKLLTTGQAAKLCSVTPDTVLKWIKKGRLTGVRTAGGHYRIERRALEPLMTGQRPPESQPSRPAESDGENLRCWEYLSDRGAVRDDCRRCVVYRVRADRCFLMAGLDSDIGHARQFCEASCEDCVYYRRVKGLATNVLVITSDDELTDRLSAEENESIAMRFAHNAYEASAIIQSFRPGFAVMDMESVPSGATELLDSLASDPRVPGLRVVLVVPPGRSCRKHRCSKNDLVVSVVEKPIGSRRMAAVIDGLLGDLFAPEGRDLQGTA